MNRYLELDAASLVRPRFPYTPMRLSAGIPRLRCSLRTISSVRPRLRVPQLEEGLDNSPGVIRRVAADVLGDPVDIVEGLL